jgi:hypothetical protein
MTPTFLAQWAASNGLSVKDIISFFGMASGWGMYGVSWWRDRRLPLTIELENNEISVINHSAFPIGCRSSPAA